MDNSSKHFFPNKSPDVMELEYRLRNVAHALNDHDRFTLYEILTSAHPALPTTSITSSNGFTKVSQLGQTICFPQPIPLIKLAHVSCGYEEWLAHKYELPGFVAVAEGDIVVDCGAYVGGFSLGASRKAAAVHLFEPAPDNFACAQKNFLQATNVTLNKVGLYSRTEAVMLNVSSSSVEHSILRPDNDVILDRIEIQVTRLDEYCERMGVSRVDFLKIEAEGVELEVFEGVGCLNVSKLAIDVSPERNGESPADRFWEILRSKGFEVEQRGHVLFARSHEPRG